MEAADDLRCADRIHVTEEARHLSFARHYLRAHVPRLKPAARVSFALQAPLILGPMAQLMMRPSADIVGTYNIPKEVVAEVYTQNPRHRAKTVEALGKVRNLLPGDRHRHALVAPAVAAHENLGELQMRAARSCWSASSVVARSVKPRSPSPGATRPSEGCCSPR